MEKGVKIQTTRIYADIDNAVKSGYRIISLQGSSRSSKTYNTLIFLIIYLIQHPNTRLSIVRGTIPALKKSVFIDLKEILIKIGIYDAKALNKSELTYQMFNGSWIELFSTDDEQKIRGAKRNILFINEANEISYIAYTQLMMRTTKFAILDYNPSYSDEHWLCNVNRDEKTFHFISTYKDNPFLEQTVIDEIESLKHKNKALWEIYGLGIQSLVEGLVFPHITLIDEFPKSAKKQAIAVDYGFSKDESAIVKCGIIDNNLYLDEICYRTHMRTSDLIETFRPYKDMKIVSESADPRLVHEISLAGFWISPVKKGPGSVEAGIMFMQGLDIHVTKGSLNLIKEFRNYIYAKNKDGKQLGVPVDAYNHCFTGDTLITTDNGDVPIMDINVGDMVLTSRGYRKVNKVFDNGRKEILHTKLIFPTLVTEVKCTSNHKFKTTKGWKKLGEIESGNVLFLCKNLMGKHTNQKEKEQINSALISVNQHIGESSELTTKQGTAKYAGKSLHAVNIASKNYAVKCVLQDICLLSKQEQNVYDLEIDEVHEYFANGMLVHNCMDASRYYVLEELMGKIRNIKPLSKSDLGIY